MQVTDEFLDGICKVIDSVPRDRLTNVIMAFDTLGGKVKTQYVPQPLHHYACPDILHNRDHLPIGNLAGRCKHELLLANALLCYCRDIQLTSVAFHACASMLASIAHSNRTKVSLLQGGAHWLWKALRLLPAGAGGLERLQAQ